MEIITTIFDQLEEDIHTRLRVLEKQIVFMLAQNQRGNNGNTEAVDFLENKVHSMTNLVSMLEQRIRSLESRPAPAPAPAPLPAALSFQGRSAGLEGLVIQPSPVLSAISVSNSVVLPTIQRTLVLNEEVEEEEVEVEVDDDAETEMLAERQGGLTAQEEDEAEEEAEVEEEEEAEVDEEEEEESEVEEEEESEVEEEEEEKEREELELEEFTWKGKTYYKDQNENVYRMVEEGVPEDEPFATYDPTNNKLTRIS